MNCQCLETQPRRGKNLPEGGLDSRAKKLSPQDREDYEFTMKWLDEFTHSIYRDRETTQIIGLNDLTEVSLCKAHSSTLYRAKKRHQRNLNQAPPSPADSNGTMMEVDIKRSGSVDSSFPLLPQPHHSPTSSLIGGGSHLAQKAREQQQHQYRMHHDPPELPDFSMMTASTSNKRKRTSTIDHKPSSSASTPLYTSSSASLFHHSNGHHHPMQLIHDNSHHPHPPPPPHPQQHHSQHNLHSSNSTIRQPTSSFSSQLPPLHLRTPSLSSLSSTLQHQLHVTPNTFNTNGSSTNNSRIPPPPPPYYKVIETVSLKSFPPKKSNKEEGQEEDNQQEPIYYIRNLAITDTYTFKDLLSEIDFAGPPPPGKRVVISDAKRERIFPLGQAIRSVIRYPTETHVEFYLGLSEKASIDWSNYK